MWINSQYWARILRKACNGKVFTHPSLFQMIKVLQILGNRVPYSATFESHCFSPIFFVLYLQAWSLLTFKLAIKNLESQMVKYLRDFSAWEIFAKNILYVGKTQEVFCVLFRLKCCQCWACYRCILSIKSGLIIYAIIYV